jgi:hypothetical protein
MRFKRVQKRIKKVTRRLLTAQRIRHPTVIIKRRHSGSLFETFLASGVEEEQHMSMSAQSL